MADQDPKPKDPTEAPAVDPANPGAIDHNPSPAFAAPALPVPVDPDAAPPVTATTPNPGPRRVPRAPRTDGTGRPIAVGTVRERAQARLDRIGQILKDAVKNLRPKTEAETKTDAPPPAADAKPADKPIDATEAPTSVVEAPALATAANPAVDTTPTAKTEAPKKGALATVARALNTPVYDGRKKGSDGSKSGGPLEWWTNFIGLYPFGETGKTEEVRAYMQQAGALIACAVVIELIFQPFSNLALFVGLGWTLQHVLGFILTFAIIGVFVKIDVGAYIQMLTIQLETRKRLQNDPSLEDEDRVRATKNHNSVIRGIYAKIALISALRTALLVMITLYNTGAIDRRKHAAEIAEEARVEETRNIETIRTTALASLNTRPTTRPDGHSICETDRCRAREELVRQHTQRYATADAEVQTATAAANGEVSGMSGTRIRGARGAYQAQLAAQRVKERAREEVRTNNAREIAAFDADTEQRIAALRTMNPDRMARLYGGTWRVDLRGIPAQDRILAKLMERSPDMRRSRNITLALFFLLQGMAFAWSFFKPEGVRRYLHPGFRALEGDKDAITELRAIGITDPTVTTYLPHIVTLNESVRDEFAKLSDGAQIVRDTIEVLAQTRDARGHHLSYEHIVTTARTRWQPSKGILRQLRGLERSFERTGATMPNWPASLNRDAKGVAHDLRLPENDPSVVTKAELIEKHGWVDPETHETSLRALNEELESVRDQVIAGIVAMDRESGRMMRDAIPAPAIVLRYTRGEKFENEILPLYFEMERLEREIKRAGGTVPDWDFQDRVGLKCSPTDLDVVEAYARVPSDGELRAISGGQLAQPVPAPVAAAPVPTPAPVAPPAKPTPVAPTTPPPASPPADAKPADDAKAREPGDRKTLGFGTPEAEAKPPVEPVVTDTN